jgi:hypothetical protein
MKVVSLMNYSRNKPGLEDALDEIAVSASELCSLKQAKED